MGSSSSKANAPPSAAVPRSNAAVSKPALPIQVCSAHQLAYSEGYQCGLCARARAPVVLGELPALQAAVTADVVHIESNIHERVDSVGEVLMKGRRLHEKTAHAALERITREAEALQGALAFCEEILQTDNSVDVLLALEAVASACNLPESSVELDVIGVLPPSAALSRFQQSLQLHAVLLPLYIDPSTIVTGGSGWESFHCGETASNQLVFVCPASAEVAAAAKRGIAWTPRENAVSVTIESSDCPGVRVGHVLWKSVSPTKLVLEYRIGDQELADSSVLRITAHVFGYHVPSWARIVPRGFTTAAEAFTVPLKPLHSATLGFAVNKAGTRALVISSRHDVDVYDCCTGALLRNSQPISGVSPPFCTAVTPADTVYIAGGFLCNICEVSFEGVQLRVIYDDAIRTRALCLAVSPEWIVICIAHLPIPHDRPECMFKRYGNDINGRKLCTEQQRAEQLPSPAHQQLAAVDAGQYRKVTDMHFSPDSGECLVILAHFENSSMILFTDLKLQLLRTLRLAWNSARFAFSGSNLVVPSMARASPFVVTDNIMVATDIGDRIPAAAGAEACAEARFLSRSSALPTTSSSMLVTVRTINPTTGSVEAKAVTVASLHPLTETSVLECAVAGSRLVLFADTSHQLLVLQ